MSAPAGLRFVDATLASTPVRSEREWIQTRVDRMSVTIVGGTAAGLVGLA